MTKLGTPPETKDTDQWEIADWIIVVKALMQTLTLADPKLSETRPNQVQSLVQHFRIEICGNAIKEHNVKTKNSSASKTFMVALTRKGNVEEELRTALKICIDVFECFIDIGAVVETATQVGGVFESTRT